MKRIITFALFILLVIGALMPTVFAEESVVYGTENGGKIKWTFDKTSGVLTVEPNGGNSLHSSQSNSRPSFCSLFCDSIREVVIKEGIEYIGREAFFGCKLERISMPSVKYIYDSAFEDCVNLKNVYMPNVIDIGARAFYRCKKLERIDFPRSLSVLETQAFAQCDSLTDVRIQKNLYLVKPNSFSGCDSLETIEIEPGCLRYFSYGNSIINKPMKTLVVGTQNSVIPDDGSVVTIESKAFENCVGLERIIIPDKVKKISDLAFFGCSGLKELTVYGDGLEEVSAKAFRGCSSLESINIIGDAGKYHTKNNCLIEHDKIILGCKKSVIPDDGSVTSIGKEAFFGATGLESIIIPEAVTDIGVRAFFECEGLQNVYLTDSVTEFKEGVFELCTSLESVIVCASKEDFRNIRYDPYYAEGAASFEIKRHDRVLEAVNYQMHALHCKVCGDAEELEEHSASGWKYVNDSKHKGVCKCGFALEDTHEWVESEWSIPATKNKQGAKRYYCAICDSERTEIVPMLHGCESNVISAPYISVIALSVSLIFRKGRLRKNGEA